MKKIRAGLPLLAAGLCLCSLAQAQGNPYGTDTRFYVAPMFSYTFSDKERGTGNGLGGSIAIGKPITKYLDLELIGFFSNYNVSNSDAQRVTNDQVAAGFPSSKQPGSLQLYGVGAGFNVYGFDSLNGLFGTTVFDKLYLHGDIMRGQGRGQPGPITNYTSTIYNVGLGYNLPLNITFGNLFAPGMALRVEALYRLDQHNRDYIGDGNHKYFQETVINVGLRIPLGGRPAPAPPAPPVQPEPPVQVVPVVQNTPPPPPPPCQPPAAGQPINLEGCKTGDTIVLRGVNFEFNKSRLTANAKTILNQVSDALLARADVQVEIDGYTDSIGSDRYNQKLSQRRADSVKQYLVGRGIDAGRMATKGYGETNSIASNETDEGRELNRRVELKIMAEGESAGAGASTVSETPAPAGAAAAGGSPGTAAPASAAPSSDSAPASGAAGDDAPAGAAPATGGAPVGAPAGGAPPI